MNQTLESTQRTQVRFDSFLSGGFITMAIIDKQETKLAKRTSVQRSVNGSQVIFGLTSR